MARNGLRFDSFHAAAPVCSPTRGSVMTGRHPLRYGIPAANSGHLPPQEITIGELLRDAGYTTGFFGKWHLGTLTTKVRDSNRGGVSTAQDYAPPWEHGFDVAFATEAAVPTYDPMLKPPRGGGWWLSVSSPRDGIPYGAAYWTGEDERARRNLSGDDSRVIMDRAIPFIEQAVGDGRPFLAVIWFHAPHMPWVADADHRRPFAEQPETAQLYFGSLLALDEQIGRLRAGLRSLRIEKDTLLWFMSDNGPEGPSASLTDPPGRTGGLRGHKRSLYEGGIRVPAVLEWPGRIPANSVCDEPTVSSDILPTLLDLLALTMPDARPLDGVRLAPAFEGRSIERTTPIAFEYQQQLALIDGAYKLLVGARESRVPTPGQEEPDVQGDYELYHLGRDPEERVDLALHQREIVTRMTRRLTDWRESVWRSRRGDDYALQRRD
jgi:arylsulfatase A-like enzyme